jgi:hypothetical protein
MQGVPLVWEHLAASESPDCPQPIIQSVGVKGVSGRSRVLKRTWLRVSIPPWAEIHQ